MWALRGPDARLMGAWSEVAPTPEREAAPWEPSAQSLAGTAAWLDARPPRSPPNPVSWMRGARLRPTQSH